MKTSLRVLVLVSSLLAPVAAGAQTVTLPPQIPTDVQVGDDFVPYLAYHAVGTQDYMCVLVGSTYTWVPFGPQATLSDAADQQVLTHFLGLTPYWQTPNPAWQHSRDSSIVWAQMIGISTDSNYVRQGAIPWLLLEALVVGEGPTGGDKLMPVRRIQRLNTVDGSAPTTGCSQPNDLKKRALVPYEADYFFYKDKPTHFRD
jgi:hypothetical protein